MGFLYYCFTRSENFLVSRFNIEIVSLLSIFHEFQNPQNFEKTLLWFISISFSLLTCLYTIWYFIQFSRYILPFRAWWRIRGSNPWPPACKAGALPAELIPHMLVFCPLHYVAARSFVGYIPKYAPSALPRAPCESCKILRIMLVFCSLRACFFKNS